MIDFRDNCQNTNTELTTYTVQANADVPYKHKFNVWDWIVGNSKHPYQISGMDESMYYFLGHTGGQLIMSIDRNFHKWTIDDAKDGDVLVYSDTITIFFYKNKTSFRISMYAKLVNDEIKTDVTDELSSTNIIKPATLEQIKFFIKKLNSEELYWDSWNKQIKSTKQNMNLFHIGDWIDSDIHHPMLITDIYKEHYIFNYDKKSRCECWIVDNEYHIWNTADMKCGDIVVDVYGTIYMFNTFGITSYKYFCYYCKFNNSFNVLVDGDVTNSLRPATLKECQLLHIKIIENGYRWDQTKQMLIDTRTEKLCKFKIGDWIVSEAKTPVKVLDITYETGMYKCVYYDEYWVEHIFSYPIDKLDEHYSKWSIENATENDILATDDVVFKYQKHDDEYVYHYVAYSVVNKQFITEKLPIDDVHPATGEQNKLLICEIPQTSNKDDDDIEFSSEEIKNLKCTKCATNDTQFNAVYCLATDDGKGVIEALISSGGNNIHQYDGKQVQDRTSSNIDDWHSIQTLYYIDADNVITQLVNNQESAGIWKLIIKLFTEIKPMLNIRWRAKKYECYYYIGIFSSKIIINETIENRVKADDSRYNIGNYFRTKELAEVVSKKILKLFNTFKNDTL